MNLLKSSAVTLLTAAAALIDGDAATTHRNVASDSDRIAWVIFVDDLHLDFVNTGRLRDLLKAMASELIREEDKFAISWSNAPPPSLILTSDRTLLDEAIRKTHGNGLKIADILRVSGENPVRNEVRHRASLALSAAYTTMRSLDEVDDLRKAFLYISNGYTDFSITTLQDQRAELIAFAARSNITIFAIDPRSLAGRPMKDPQLGALAWKNYWTETRASLRWMAEQTGGIALIDEPDLRQALPRINVWIRG